MLLSFARYIPPAICQLLQRPKNELEKTYGRPLASGCCNLIKVLVNFMCDVKSNFKQTNSQVTKLLNCLTLTVRYTDLQGMHNQFMVDRIRYFPYTFSWFYQPGSVIAQLEAPVHIYIVLTCTTIYN